jgi:hypothetical protein
MVAVLADLAPMIRRKIDAVPRTRLRGFNGQHILLSQVVDNI